jgi:hypothetical protein
MTDPATMRTWTAHHEAGHAVATLMRNGALDSVTIDATVDHWGRTLGTVPPLAGTFVIHAGPWAEARFRWPLSTRDLDDFSGYVHGVWQENVADDGDSALYELARSIEEASGIFLSFSARENDWDAELESHRLVIEAVADLLLIHGTLTGEVVKQLFDEMTVAQEGKS